MSDAQTVINEIGDEQGWNDLTKLEFAIEYIKNQQSPEAWEDFLQQCADQENEMAGK
jgi:hypothetical protein